MYYLSLKATNENIAMVTLHVENITWLGKPYSICVREPDYGFTYTKQNCLLECEGKNVFGCKIYIVNWFISNSAIFLIGKCGCIPPQHRDVVSHLKFTQCSIYDHLICLRESYVEFEGSYRKKCGCDDKCERVNTKLRQVQYGHKWVSNVSRSVRDFENWK